MSYLTDSQKINYIFKKTQDKPTTVPNLIHIQEPCSIHNNIIHSKPILFPQKQLYRDTITNTVPSELLNVVLDDNSNNINGSIIGKTSYDGLIKKYVKITLQYVYGSEKILDSNIISIAFFSDLLQNSIPYNFDPYGSYSYTLYKSNDDLITYDEGNWILDNETGILTFHSHITNIDKNNPPKITFYKYNGNIGLYPLHFNKNASLTIKTNLNIDNSLVIKENITLNNIHFNKLNQLPSLNSNQLVYVDNNLYFNNNNKWQKIINEELVLLNHEQYIYDSNTTNIIDVNKNLSIIEITTTLNSDIFIILPNLQKNAVEKTIIMGQSINNFINGYNIVLYSKFLDVGGTGPSYMNLKFINSGQLVKLVSIVSNTENIYGYGNKYWQILIGHFHSTDIFELVNGQLTNTTDNNQSYQSYVNDTQYEQFTNVNIDNNFYQNTLIDTHFINISGSNTISLLSNTTVLQLDNFLTNDIIITLNINTNNGQNKIILSGDTISTYKNGYTIYIQSTYMGGSNIEFLTSITPKSIIFSKSGQSVNLISMSSSTGVNYWHIMNGDFTFSI